MSRRPSYQYYPKDWRSDPVFTCSIGARGLWHEMMDMMHFAERYGYLSMNGLPIPDEAVARYCGVSLQDYQTLLSELERASVPRRTSDGVIYSKRMVEDERQRRAWKKHKENSRKTNVEVVDSIRHPHLSYESPVVLQSPSPPTKIKTKPTPSPAAILPDWVPRESWFGFLEMRVKNRISPTHRALQMLLKTLTRLRDAGNDPAAVLDQSTERGWRGLFEVKTNGHHATNEAMHGENPFHGSIKPEVLERILQRRKLR